MLLSILPYKNHVNHKEPNTEWQEEIGDTKAKERAVAEEGLGSLCEGATSIPNTETGKRNSDPPEIHQESTAMNLIQGRSHLGRPSITGG